MCSIRSTENLPLQCEFPKIFTNTTSKYIRTDETLSLIMQTSISFHVLYEKQQCLFFKSFFLL